ncbi:rhodanese-like domain-containing protein [Candidatus Uhrbacteria bacterium]|nr:rhodanese-like domain-containing protein [Candidatus Uhrbacteria bacterium]
MPNKIPHVTCEHLVELGKKEQKEHVVVDVRDFIDYEAGHIKDSLNVPARELTTNLETLVPDKGGRVIVVAGSTQEPEIESIHQTLVDLGYKKVEFLAGGFDSWCEIAPIELEADLTDRTPEEKGFTGDDLADIDPEKADGEPLL